MDAGGNNGILGLEAWNIEVSCCCAAVYSCIVGDDGRESESEI